jgi:hypothetical protein
MKNIKFVVTALIVTLLHGCATGVKSADEIRLTQNKPTVACAMVGNALAASNIASGYSRCHSIGKDIITPVFVGGAVIRIASKNTSFVRIEEFDQKFSVVIGTERGISQVYDILTTENCQSEVTARGLGPLHNFVASSAIRFAINPESSCKKP